jgi:hypothetical protein
MLNMVYKLPWTGTKPENNRKNARYPEILAGCVMVYGRCHVYGLHS